LIPALGVFYIGPSRGGVAKRLRRRSAKPLLSGSNPLATSNSSSNFQTIDAARWRSTCPQFALTANPAHGPPSNGIGWGLYAFSIGGQLADWASTVHFQSTGLLVEQNARLRGRGPARLFAIKAGWGLAAAVVGDVVKRRAERHGPRWARHLGRAMPIVAGGTGFFMAARNELRLAHARHHAASSP
jgi:hypothetical protein